MKHFCNIRTVFVLIFGFTFLINNPIYGQSNKKKARISLNYTKIMPNESTLNISAKYKGEKGYEPAKNLEFNIYKLTQNNEATSIGKTITDHSGLGTFNLDSSHLSNNDTIVNGYMVAIEKNERFKSAKKSIEIYDINLIANVILKDSTHYIKATLTKPQSLVPLTGEALKVRLQRLFAPLPIGKGIYYTDENGSILVPIEKGLPGLDGILTFEVALDESDTYGTVKSIVSKKIGTPIVNHSSFNERTMWSPPTKTPLFIWIFPNLLILGVWSTIILLVINLIKIYKSKN